MEKKRDGEDLFGLSEYFPSEEDLLREAHLEDQNPKEELRGAGNAQDLLEGETGRDQTEGQEKRQAVDFQPPRRQEQAPLTDEAAKPLWEKHSPRWHLRWIIPLILLILTAFALIFYFSHRKSRIGDIFVIQYEGYNGNGRLVYNTEQVNERMIRLIGRKVGLKKDQIEAMIHQNTDSLRDLPEYQQATQYLEGTSIRFDKESNLSNGDQITLRIQSNFDSSPIENEQRNYTVSGLPDMQEMTLDQVQEEYPIQFRGYNGYGSLDYDEEIYTADHAYSNLSNGDSVHLTLSNTFLENASQGGKKIDEKEINLTVNGLRDVGSIGRIADVANQIDNLAKAANMDQNGDYNKVTYQLEKQRTMIYYRDDKMNVMSIYRVVRSESTRDILFNTWRTTDRISYQIYGYTNLDVQSDSLVTSNLEDHGGRFNYTDYVDLKAAEADLASRNYKEY